MTKMSDDADRWLWSEPPSDAFGGSIELTFDLCDVIYDILKGGWEFENYENLRKMGLFFYVNPTTPIEIEHALIAGNWK